MARSGKLKWETCIEIDGKMVKIASGDGEGNVTRYLPEEEFQPYEEKMMENVGKSVSRYLMTHPDSGMWDV